MRDFGKIDLLAVDVDGTQTDGSMVTHGRSTIKFFNARDGLATNLAVRCGIKVYWISGGFSESVEYRAECMGISGLIEGCTSKGTRLKELAAELNIPIENTAFIGDDLNDIPGVKEAGIGIAVADAAEELKEIADYVTSRPGGHGAVREVVELILKQKGLWKDIVENFEDYAISDRKGTVQ